MSCFAKKVLVFHVFGRLRGGEGVIRLERAMKISIYPSTHPFS